MAMQNSTVDHETLGHLEDYISRNDHRVKLAPTATLQHHSAVPEPSLSYGHYPNPATISPYDSINASVPPPVVPRASTYPQLPPGLRRPLHAGLSIQASSPASSPDAKRVKRSGSSNTDGRSSHGSTPYPSGSQPSRGTPVSTTDGFQPARSRVQWSVNNNETWHRIFDEHMSEIPQPGFRVEIDKGFKRSSHDGSFICQKKNHFQVTVALKVAAPASYVATREGLLRVSSLFVSMHGAKVESPSDHIQLEQSQSDRSKQRLDPVTITPGANEVVKLTVGRLHFSETTSNNMRKKGKPNPDQRYFSLVVSLVAKAGDRLYTVASHRSENLVVRASNPGQFEPDMQAQWQRGATPGSVIHTGNVGVNIDSPDEALCIQGNLRLSGAILQPSDRRVKTSITPAHTAEQLANIQRLPLYHYKLTSAWAKTVGREADQPQFGVLAQELQQVLPEAVTESSSVELKDGSRVDRLLVVDKERLFMEAVGAVQELAKQNQQLSRRLATLEGLLVGPGLAWQC